VGETKRIDYTGPGSEGVEFEGTYWVVPRFTDVGDRREVTGWTIELVDPDRPLTVGELRRIPLAELAEVVRRGLFLYEMLQASTAAEDLDEIVAEQAAARAIRLRRGRRKPGEPRYSEGHWQAVAATYRRARREGLSPRDEIAHRYKVTPTTAKSWIARLRHEKGLI
jgi:hypothetical protein